MVAAGEIPSSRGPMGSGDLASYGATDVRTANIDRLAREGVRPTDAYANGQVSPRAGR